MGFLETERLIQYHELRPAKPIEEPETLTLDELQNWWQTAKNICLRGDYVALSFNQIPEKLLREIGFAGLKPEIIYIAEDAPKGKYDFPDLRGCLVINPEVNIPTDITGVAFEGCGSIRDPDGVMPHMFVQRPYVLAGKAYLWKPGDEKPKLHGFVVAETTSAIIHHEKKHLDGLTALSQPDKIIDIRDWGVLSSILSLYDRSSQIRILRTMIKAGIVIYDVSQRKILRIRSNHEIVEEYADLSAPNIPF